MKYIKNTIITASIVVLLGGCGTTKTVVDQSPWMHQDVTKLAELTIQQGDTFKAPEGYELIMTIDGVETAMQSGRYSNVVITKVKQNLVEYKSFEGSMVHPFRQALYIDETGLVEDKSVTVSAGDYTFSNGMLNGGNIRSNGESFNGLYVSGGNIVSKNLKVTMNGNGGNDFAGWGAGIMSTGKNTTLVVDGADVHTIGAIRTAVIAQGGSNLVIKNSIIKAENGILPSDYVSNVTPGLMKDAPWMLGITGNNRATNLLGPNTTATYINSQLFAEGWGILSIDDSRNTKLTTINSHVEVTGESGYGSYAIGDSRNAFYGTTFNVPDYSVIVTGGDIIFGASTPEKVRELNNELKLGLTDKELARIQPKDSEVKSKRFGIMWHGNGTVDISGNTDFYCGNTIFLVKGAKAGINVDGALGTELNSRSGVILQIIDNDDPGPVMVNGVMQNIGIYKESDSMPEPLEGFDTMVVNENDVTASFENINLKGDFYNAITGKPTGGAMGSDGPNGPAGPPNGDDAMALLGMDKGPAGKNMVIDFGNAWVTGVISSAKAKHTKSEINSDDYKLLGVVINTPSPAINNGTIVSLKNSTWTVTGTSYLTKLSLLENAKIEGQNNNKVIMTINGTETPIKTGEYKGAIVLSVSN